MKTLLLALLAVGGGREVHAAPVGDLRDDEVDDVGAELDRLETDGAELIDREPRQGLFGLQVAFVHSAFNLSAATLALILLPWLWRHLERYVPSEKVA